MNLMRFNFNFQFYIDINSKSSGSTATICILKDSVNLFIGHVGDSRAILCRSGEARKLTTDHEPSLISERVSFLFFFVKYLCDAMFAQQLHVLFTYEF